MRTRTVQPVQTSPKDFLFFAVRRVLTELIAVMWGFMLGGASLVTLAVTALLGGYVVYSTAQLMKNIYHRSSARSAVELCRLYAEGTFYGVFAPLCTAYSVGRVFVLKCRLTYWINKSNKNALEHRKNLDECHSRATGHKGTNKEIPRNWPRGDSRMAALHLKAEELRLMIKEHHEENEACLLKCRKRARDLGIVL